jgi:diguanylate cyclase (GGDEF)-like protein/PAS domain S-box-containing protein
MNRSIRAKIVVGLISSIAILALVAFLVYWSRGAEAQASRAIPLLMIAGFSAMALVLSGISAWLLMRELRNSLTQRMAIAANEAQYHELCDNAFDLIDMLTPDGKFVYTNRAWREALGYTAEEASHLWLKDVVHPEDFPYSQKSICGLLAGEPGRNRFEVRFRKKSGEVIHLEGAVNCRRGEARPTVIQGILREVTARKQAEQELRELQRRLQVALEKEKELARVDPLTHLSNRRAFYEQAEVEIARAWRYSRPLCIAYMDINNFKLVNDRLGHSTGDALLVTLASTLRSELRASDLVGRMGGDEFAVLLPETDAASAESVLTKLQENLLQTMKQNAWNVTFSIGAASFPKPPASLEGMIRVADEAMSAIKAQGKNDVSVVVVDRDA